MQMRKAGTRNRNYFLFTIGMIVVVSIAMYNCKLAHTVQLLDNYRDASTTLFSSVESKRKLGDLKAKLGDMKDRKNTSVTKEQMQQALLDDLTALCQGKKATVIGISEAALARHGTYEVLSFSVELTGAYHDMVRMLNNFEGGAHGMRLASARFESHMNRQSKKKQLNAYLHVQHIRST
jgi:Tfp pilus assembly protein PilO